jgi:hypothetical protein
VLSTVRYAGRSEKYMLLDPLMFGAWIGFAVYAVWYFFKAETIQPLTLDDLALTWQVHKRETGCTASRLDKLLTKEDEVVGFKCDCGYEFQQKRLITQKIRKPIKSASSQQQTSKQRAS